MYFWQWCANACILSLKKVLPQLSHHFSHFVYEVFICVKILDSNVVHQRDNYMLRGDSYWVCWNQSLVKTAVEGVAFQFKRINAVHQLINANYHHCWVVWEIFQNLSLAYKIYCRVLLHSYPSLSAHQYDQCSHHRLGMEGG